MTNQVQENSYKTIAEFLGYSVIRYRVYYQLQEPDGKYYPAVRLSEASAWCDIEYLFIEEGRIHLLRILRKNHNIWNKFFNNLHAVITKRVSNVVDSGLNPDRALLLTMANTRDIMEALYTIAITGEKL